MKKITLIFIAFLSVVTGLLLILSTPKDVKKTYVQFSTPADQILKGTLYSPYPPKSPSSSGVVLVHGVIVNKEYMAALARTLAENGLSALVFDLGGYGESYARSESKQAVVNDVIAAAAYLRKRIGTTSPNNKIGLVGHSMGGTAVVLAGLLDPTIDSVVCLGMSAEVPAFKPCRLLWGTGIYDQLHSPREMREVIAHSTAESGCSEDIDYRQNDCTHRLTLSPTSNHQTELSDNHLLKEVTRWLIRSLDQPLSSPEGNAIDRKSLFPIKDGRA